MGFPLANFSRLFVTYSYEQVRGGVLEDSEPVLQQP
jgi:hypothetical protein